MNKKALFGQYFTPKEVAECMVRLCDDASDFIVDKKICEPSCGDGSFLIPLIDTYGSDVIKAVEIDEDLRITAINNVYNRYKINVSNIVLLHNHLEAPVGDFNIIIGNPPYNVRSVNKSRYITDLMQAYFREPETIQKLTNERNTKNINDDYCKFIRLAEEYVKNKDGVVCYITNSGYLENKTFRGMRYHLLQTFDEIYIINMKGENVFDIKTPVAIFIGIRRKEKDLNTIGKVYYTELSGTRSDKFSKLSTIKKRSDIPWEEVQFIKPHYFFVPKVLQNEEYNTFLPLRDMFILKSTGVQTSMDSFIIDARKDVLEKRIREYESNDYTKERLKALYKVGENGGVRLRKQQGTFLYDQKKVMKIAYRPLDTQYIYYDRTLLNRDRYDTMKHIIGKENVGLILERGHKKDVFSYSSVSKTIVGSNVIGAASSLYPLYTYEDDIKLSNIKHEYTSKIEEIIGYTPSPEDILGYVYAVLHSPKYRETYKEYLKIDFPKVPYPVNTEQFDALKTLGNELMTYHLLENDSQTGILKQYKIHGTTDSITVNVKKSTIYKDNKVYINSDTWVENVSEEVYNTTIGDHQVAYKWLYDRNRMTLTHDEIQEYRRILIALEAQIKIVNDVDNILDKIK